MLNIFFLALLITMASVLAVTASELRWDSERAAVQAALDRRRSRAQQSRAEATAPTAAAARTSLPSAPRRSGRDIRRQAPAPVVFHEIKPAARGSRTIPFRRKIELYTPEQESRAAGRADDCSA